MAILRIGICLCLLGLAHGFGRKVGGPGRSKPIDESARQVVNSVKDDILASLTAEDRTLIFEPISYKTQVVAGMNYFVKIKTAANRYIHVRIYRHFSGRTSLADNGVQTGKSLSDEITYF